MQELESQERKAARKARTAELLAKYKKINEMDMDPATEAAVQALFESGSELMRKGRLQVVTAVIAIHSVLISLSQLSFCSCM